jgi:hypothetical protein
MDGLDDMSSKVGRVKSIQAILTDCALKGGRRVVCCIS